MPNELAIALHLPLHTESGHRNLRGVLRYVEEHPNIRLMDFCFSKEEPSIPKDAPPWTGQVQGVVLEVGFDPGIVQWIQRGGVPAANAAGDLMDSPIVSVYPDVKSLVRTGIEHLIGLGFRDFAYIGFANAHSSRHRRKAFVSELKKWKCEQHVVEVRRRFWLEEIEPFEISRFDPSIVKLVQTATKPLAIFALNDFIAIRLCRLALELGFRVPQDVGVLGVGDTVLTRISSPPISTIQTPVESIGYEAARLVHRMIEGRRLARKNLPVFGEKLIARASTVGDHRTTHADIQQALDVIRHRACEGATIADIAADLHMSVRTLETQFAAEVGHPIGEELRRVRLARAEELLANTDLSLTRVAALVGCNDSAYLTRLFRRRFHQTPSEYRKQKSVRK